MFAYYADGHKGICLEFKVGFEHEIGVAAPVVYPPAFPLLNYIQVHKDLSNILIFRKAPFWAHERELRAFRYDVPPGYVSFSSNLLRRVIFGSEATSETVTLVKKWCSAWESPLVLAHAKPMPDRFELRIEDFEELPGRIV